MGVETFDCYVCHQNGIHEDYIKHCGSSHCHYHICIDCVKKNKLEVNDDDEIINCPVCEEKKKIEQTYKMLEVLLEIYNKRRRNKLTKEKLLEMIN